MDEFPEVIVQAALDYRMGQPVTLLRLDQGTLETVRGAIARLRQIGEQTEYATGNDLVKLDEEASTWHECLSDIFTSALEDAGLVAGENVRCK